MDKEKVFEELNDLINESIVVMLDNETGVIDQEQLKKLKVIANKIITISDKALSELYEENKIEGEIEMTICELCEKQVPIKYIEKEALPMEFIDKKVMICHPESKEVLLVFEVDKDTKEDAIQYVLEANRKEIDEALIKHHYKVYIEVTEKDVPIMYNDSTKEVTVYLPEYNGELWTLETNKRKEDTAIKHTWEVYGDSIQEALLDYGYKLID